MNKTGIYIGKVLKSKSGGTIIVNDRQGEFWDIDYCPKLHKGVHKMLLTDAQIKKILLPNIQ